MAQDLVLLTPPTAEPLSLADAKAHLRVDFADDDAYITGLIIAARQTIEDWLRRPLITQEWLLKLDGFPGYSQLYNRIGYPEIHIPKPPFQTIVSFQYVDVSGTLQTLAQQTDYGVNQNMLYGYQLDPGSIDQPARVLPPFARPWPPCRLVPNNVLIDFWCGYCDADFVTIAGVALGTLTGLTFPQNRNGAVIYIPGAGPNGTTLQAKLAVDGSGNGTITPAASQPVTNALAFVGGLVPPVIIIALKLQIAHLYTHRGEDVDDAKDCGMAPAVKALLNSSRNLIA